MNSAILLVSGIVFLVISFFLVFYTKASVKVMMDSKREYYESKGYNDEQIAEWTNGERWYLFYKILGIFGLLVTSLAICTTVKQLVFQ